MKQIYLIFKRAVDFLIALVSILILWPVFLLLMLAVKIDSRGPVLYSHKRVGKDHKVINVYKFRTMVTDSHDFDKYFTDDQKKEFEENYKLERDPRVTRVGAFLRKTSLDELPQIFNILKGDMAFIGPRPVTQEELRMFGGDVDKMLSVRPGLTGYWASHGRSNTTYEERVKLEMHYVNHMSPMLDMAVFFKSIEVVVKGDGAK